MDAARGKELIENYKQLHAEKVWGNSSEYQLGYIQRALSDAAFSPRRILDFGCGQSRLVDWLAAIHGATPLRYDPAIPAHATRPKGPVEFVICNDVMEHIPEENVDHILGEIRALSPNCFFAIDCFSAGTTLPNGENAHCTVQPPRWWRLRIEAQFPRVRRVRNHSGQKKATFLTLDPALEVS